MSRTPKFKGWDFTELAVAWGIKLSDDCLDDEVDIKAIRDHIFERFAWPDGKLDEAIKKDMRLFLKSLIKCEQHYGTPIWRALLKIDDDFTFAQYFCTLLPHMWT